MDMVSLFASMKSLVEEVLVVALSWPLASRISDQGTTEMREMTSSSFLHDDRLSGTVKCETHTNYTDQVLSLHTHIVKQQLGQERHKSRLSMEKNTSWK